MYYIIFLLGIILAFVNDKNKVSFYIYLIVLAIFAFMRFGLGTDYFAYDYLFTRLNESVLIEISSGIDNQEIGFRIFGALIKNAGLSYQWYIIIISAINLWFISKTCLKHSKNPTLSLLIYYSFYYFVWTWSGLRQGLVLSIGIYYLLQLINNRNYKKFVFIVAGLSLFHSSSLILLVLAAVIYFNFNKLHMILFFILSMAFAFIPLDILLTRYAWLPFAQKLMPYLSQDSSIINIFDIQSLGRAVFIVIVLFYYDLLTQQGEFSKKLLQIYIVGIAFYFIFKSSELTAARLSIYGKILDIIILPNIYYLYKDKIDKLLYLCLLLILCSLYFVKELQTMERQSGLIRQEGTLFTPYVNIFNKEKFHFDSYHYEKLFE